ncbi:MAG: hypothetical protein ACR2QA_14215 [Solirubrobacteraceae bacterium]
MALGNVLPAGAGAEQASQPGSPAAALLDAGAYHTCAILDDGSVRCWGYGASGQLGYGNTHNVGDDETPASVGPVDLGPSRSAKAIAAGDYHTCAILDDDSVRCWGFGAEGRLGYGNTSNVGDKQTPGSVGPVNLGSGRTATAISAGDAFTCAILDHGSVRCWGYGANGRLGYGNTSNIGDTQTPVSVGPVDLGPGRTAKAISAGGGHACAILDDGSVRCWGYGGDGQLGYGNTHDVLDPSSVGPVNLGPGRTATAISAGGRHTCAILDDGTVRCWGEGASGQLGYGNFAYVGDKQTPDTVGPVDLGAGHTATAISAGQDHTCAILEDQTVRCWGYGLDGRLGYGNSNDVGDHQTPASAGSVDIGPGRTATAISAGGRHTCARLDDGAVRCWGYGADGQLGYCNTDDVGDDESPGSVGTVNLEPGDHGAGCAAPVDQRQLETLRARALRHCLAQAAHEAKPQRSGIRERCLRRYGLTPGRIDALHASAVSGTEVVLSFSAPSSDGQSAPAARAYLVEQSRHPIRRARRSKEAQALCKGYCRFKVTIVGTRITLEITHLRPHTTYYYVLAARDNVSGRLGPRSRTVEIRTR